MMPELIQELECTVRGAAGLGGRFFLDPDILRLEQDRFFRASWACTGLADDVPLPGDAAPVELLGEPLLMLRNRDGRLNVFHNVCSHRGAKLVDSPRKCVVVTCPYHAWSYNLDGGLVQTPHVGGPGIHDCPGIDPALLGLKPVRAAEWAGLVFVNLSGQAPAFSEYIKPLVDRWHRHDLSNLRHVRGLTQRPTFHANWKLVVENFVESYHLPWVHGSMNQYNPMEDHYQILGGRHFVGQGVRNHRPTADFARMLPYFPGLSGAELDNGESMFLPPNLLIIFMSQFVFANILSPVDAVTTKERVELFVAGDDGLNPELAAAHRELMDILVQVNNEDIGVCELMQQGRHSSAFTGGVFAPRQETTTLAFQRLLALRILEASGVPVSQLPDLPAGEIHHTVAQAGHRQPVDAP